MHLRHIASVLLLAGAVMLTMGCQPRGNAHLPETTPAMAKAAQARWPDATVDQLTRGRILMGARCSECHGLADPASEPANEWPEIMRRMAKKAKLDAAQREDVLRYVLAARDVH